MSLSFLLIGGSVFAIAVLYVTATRGSAVHPALAADNTAVGLRDAGETLVGGTPTASKGGRADWQLTTMDNLSVAEEMLDCLEANGVSERELIVLGNSCFAVRWR